MEKRQRTAAVQKLRQARSVWSATHPVAFAAPPAVLRRGSGQCWSLVLGAFLELGVWCLVFHGAFATCGGIIRNRSSVSVFKNATSAFLSSAVSGTPPSGCLARFGSSVGDRLTPLA